MWTKKIATSLICMLTIVLLCSTSYASTSNSEMKKDLNQSLTKLEKVFLNERSHYNLNDNDDISGNLQLGEIYENNNIDITNNDNTDESSKKLKHDNYVSTIKLKDSDKPIALAFISKTNSKWIITSMNSYNLLDKKIEEYKETVNSNPTVIIDQANQIYALASEKNNSNKSLNSKVDETKTNNSLELKIIEPSKSLDLKDGQFINLNELQPKLVKNKNSDSEIATGAPTEKTTKENISTFQYVYLLIPTIILASESSGVLNETFVYHCLLDKIPTVPMFATYGDGELDFVYRDRESGYVYGIEVKAGRNAGKTITKSLANGKIDFAVYLKGVTQGGIANKTYTIPIFLFPRFKFSKVSSYLK